MLGTGVYTLKPLNMKTSIYSAGFRQSPLFPEMLLQPQLLSFLSCLRDMPLAWRKLALAVTRVQVNPTENSRFSSELDVVFQSDPYLIDTSTSLPYGRSHFQDSLAYIVTSPLLSSLASYCIRAENFKPADVTSIMQDGVLKELHAATQPDIPTGYVGFGIFRDRADQEVIDPF
jgi:hypothetical protein